MTSNQFRFAIDRLGYSPETGEFIWKVPTRNSPPGKRAGCLTSAGQVAIQINGRPYMAHHLAWYFVHGRMPSGLIDHINRNRADNRIANLREATASQNQWNRNRSKNNTSGIEGVSWRARRGKWYASIAVNGRSIHLGSFNTKEEAAAARAKARAELHGEYGRAP